MSLLVGLYILSSICIIHFHVVVLRESVRFLSVRLAVVKISLEWVTGPEKGKSSGRTVTFSLWTGMFRDGISCIPGESVIPLWLCRHFLVCENRVYHEKVRMTVG